MKRAAILVLAIATLVLLGSPSTPLLADSPNAYKASPGPSVVAPTGAGDCGAPQNSGSNGGGSTDQGDADGLSGMKVQPGTGFGTQSSAERFVITVKMWWRYMLWIR
jgi:hypothetical protein